MNDITVIRKGVELKPEVQLEVVRENPDNISKIGNPTEEAFIEAIKIDPETIRHHRNPTEEMCLLAVKAKPYTIRWLKKKSDDVCIVALKGDLGTVNMIRKTGQGFIKRAIEEVPGFKEHVEENPSNSRLKIKRSKSFQGRPRMEYREGDGIYVEDKLVEIFTDKEEDIEKLY